MFLCCLVELEGLITKRIMRIQCFRLKLVEGNVIKFEYLRTCVIGMDLINYGLGV